MATKNKGNRQLNIFFNAYSDLVAASLICVALVAAYILVIRPRFKNTMETIAGNINEQEMIYEQQSHKLERLKASLVAYQKLDKEKVARLSEVLPDKYVEERLFGELEEIISRSGYTVSSIEIERPTESDSSAEVPVSQPIEDEEGSGQAGVGSVEADVATAPVIPDSLKVVEVALSIGSIDYAGLKNLLPVFENSLRFMDVTSVSFSPGEKSANLSLKTYYYQSTK